MSDRPSFSWSFSRVRSLAGASLSVASTLGVALVLSGCGASGYPASTLRSPDRAESPPDPQAAGVIAFVRAQVGKRYCWGGDGPGCFDCSGLAHAAWSRAGIRVPRTSDDISKDLPEVPPEEVRAGDILWWPGHVAVYVGGGRMVDARNARRGVVEGPVRDDFRAFRPEG